MLLANDCENPDRVGDPSARSTGLPELDGYDTSRDADGQLETVAVTIRLRTHKGNSSARFTCEYGIEDGAAVPRRVDFVSNHADAPLGVRRYLTVLLAAQEAVGRLDDIDALLPVTEVLYEIEAAEPENGYTPTDGIQEYVSEVRAEVHD